MSDSVPVDNTLVAPTSAYWRVLLEDIIQFGLTTPGLCKRSANSQTQVDSVIKAQPEFMASIIAPTSHRHNKMN
jgi:hypothetical protein